MKLDTAMIKDFALSYARSLFLEPLMTKPRSVQMVLGAATAVTAIGWSYMGNLFAAGAFFIALGLFAVSLALPQYQKSQTKAWTLTLTASVICAAVGVALFSIQIVLWAVALVLLIIPVVIIFFIIRFLIRRKKNRY